MLTKCLQYFDMVETWGTWAEFQILLSKLSSIAQKYGPAISLTNVAARWVLQQPAVGAVIVGTRLGVSSHAAENLNVFRFRLDEEDMAMINGVALGGPGLDKVRAVFERLGDCGNEYRAMH
jgi:diketogulonate reductase-like aldo/keto reductase